MNKNNNILQLLTCTTTYLCPERRLNPTFFNTLLQNKHFYFSLAGAESSIYSMEYMEARSGISFSPVYF